MRTKKLLSVLLAAVLSAGMLSVLVFAAPLQNPQAPTLNVSNNSNGAGESSPIALKWGSGTNQTSYTFADVFDGDYTVLGGSLNMSGNIAEFTIQNNSNYTLDLISAELVANGGGTIYFSVAGITNSTSVAPGNTSKIKITPINIPDLSSAETYQGTLKIKVRALGETPGQYNPSEATVGLKLEMRGPRNYAYDLQAESTKVWALKNTELDSTAYHFSVKNTGNVPQNFQVMLEDVVASSGDKAKFTLSKTSSFVLQPGSFETVILRPTDQLNNITYGQEYQAKIVVKNLDNNSEKSFVVKMTVTEADEQFEITGNLDFGEWFNTQVANIPAKEFTITNSSSVAHTFTLTWPAAASNSFTFTGDTGTSATATSISKSLMPNTSFKVTVKPKSTLVTGDYSATVTLSSSGQGARPKTRQVILKVVDPNYSLETNPLSLDFGTASLHEDSDSIGAANQPAAQNITVKNTGDENQTGLNYTFTSGGENFIVTSFTKGAIAKDATMTFSVQPKSTLDAGTHTAVLKVFSSKVPEGVPVNITFEVTAPNHTLILDKATLDFGAAGLEADKNTVGTNRPAAQSVTVTNNGETRQSGLNYEFVSGGNVFEVANFTKGTIEKDATMTFDIQPKTSAGPGVHSGTLKVYTKKFPAGVTIDFTFEVTVDTDRHTISASPNNVNFPAMEVEYGKETTGSKRPDSKEIKIENTGPVTQTNLIVTFVSGSDKFALTGNANYSSLAPGGKFSFYLQPKTDLALGTHEAELLVQSAENPAGAVTVKAFFEVIKGDKSGVMAPALQVYDRKGDILTDINGGTFPNPFSPGRVTLEQIGANQVIYICLGTKSDDRVTFLDKDGQATASQLVDSSLFKITTKKTGDGKSTVKAVEQASKSFTGQRGSYLMIDLGEMKKTGEQTAEIAVTFKARKKTADFDSGETATLNIKLFIQNKTVSGSDGSASTGESITFEPEPDTKNTLVFGDERAAIVFDADEDADGFYARLSTKADKNIYSTYGDPVDADLWFYTFAGSALPSTSRATVILGIPWNEDEEDDYNHEDMHIYQLIDRELYDVTSLFNYSEGQYEIDGWVTRTRTLGTYVVSNKALDVDALSPGSSGGGSSIPTAVEKPVANTGKHIR